MQRIRILRTLALVVGTAVAFYIAVVAGWFLFADEACSNELLYESVSPDNSIKAVVFQRACGATTDFSTQASIIHSNEKLPNESGNAFRSDTDHGAAPSGPGGGPTVKVQWQSAVELLISHHPAARVFNLEPSVGRVKVREEKVLPKQDG